MYMSVDFISHDAFIFVYFLYNFVVQKPIQSPLITIRLCI